MINSLAILALALVLAGTAVAQQKQPRRTSDNKSTSGTMSANDAARSSTSAANTHDGTNGASTGTGLTSDQHQADASGSNRGTTKVDAASSVRTGPSNVKAKKKTPKNTNQ
ncbi:hypothetical protein [Spirosoma pollinicola]|uniref:Uncharacterized protein n=1 Tax=Spirosoma pollinicola TaxID=2057025 RepID=A0A2K8Z2B4_9BACT|nr:hypothetical protein [Spirosoma pollinicola]AUD03969.1 hypothetical protein CWM47_20365 [Spirosoma pollinicola]